MVVITIITVVSGMGIVRYAASLARYRADLAARKVAGDIALAQARARATSAATQIRFSTGANAYQMPGETLGNASSPTVVSLNNPSLGATLLSVSIVGGGSNLNFDGFGQPLATATVRVGVGAETRTLTVDASTGAISIANP
jgi:Tfp pilus assembly protein FimT